MRNLKGALLAVLTFGAAACGGHAAVKPDASAPIDAAGIRARAEGKQAAAAAEPVPPGATVPDSAVPERRELDSRKGKILGKDSEGCTWLEGESLVVVGEQDSRAQARASAVAQARAAAVQDFLGVDVNARLVDFQQEGLRHNAHLTESILQTSRSGRILKEEILEENYASVGDCRDCRFHVRLKTCVLPRDERADKDFHVELRLNRTRFVKGDEAKITVTATRDCSIYLYDVYDLGAHDKTALIVPNEAVPTKTLKAGETWEFPDEDAKKRGVTFSADLVNPADDMSAEVIRVVASVTPLPKAIYDPTDGGYLGVMRRLHRSGVEWTDDSEPYTVYQR